MNEHDPKAEERVEDLDVPESESEEVKGGLLPAAGAANQLKIKLDAGQYNVKLNPGSAKFGDGSV
jgi:hypothetical protein